MFKVKLSDGTTVELPAPEGKQLQQLGLRVMYLNRKIDLLEEKEVHAFVDDIIFLLLDHWKKKKVQEPFQKLLSMVNEDKLNFEHPIFKKYLTRRVKENNELVKTFKNGSQADKNRVKDDLKSRGFIGKRSITEYDKEFLEKAGIEI